jgi:adenosylmethionine-8-amino-7-oxononanoate aminotransferase
VKQNNAKSKSYFDAIGGIFVATLGHGHPRLIEAMRRQMEKMTFAAPLHGIADVTLDFMGKIGSVTPGNLKYVKPFSGGSEAVEAAMKFVRQYFKQTGHPGKYKFISRYFGYHGGTAGGMAASPTGARKTNSPTAIRSPATRSRRPQALRRLTRSWRSIWTRKPAGWATPWWRGWRRCNASELSARCAARAFCAGSNWSRAPPPWSRFPSWASR